MTLARYVGTAVCARLADESARVAVLLLAIERTGRPGLGGLLVAALMVPHVLAAPAVGGLADRVRRRRLFHVAVFLAFAGLVAAAAVLIGRSDLAAAAVLALAGCCAPILIGGLSSLLGELAGDRLERAFGLDVTSYNVAGIAGPALAAGIAAAAGAVWAVAAVAALMVAGAVLFATLPLGDRPAAAEKAGRFGALRLMARHRELGAVTAASVLATFGLGALPMVAALLAARAHSTAYTGLVLSSGAVGAVVASLLCTAYPIKRRPPVVIVLVCLAAAVPCLVAAALAPAGWSALPLFALVGASGAPMAVAVFAVRDRAAPPHLRTQVFTLGAGLKVTGAALGSAAAGLAAGAGPGALLLGVAVCQVLAIVAVLTRVSLPRRLRENAG